MRSDPTRISVVDGVVIGVVGCGLLTRAGNELLIGAGIGAAIGPVLGWLLGGVVGIFAGGESLPKQRVASIGWLSKRWLLRTGKPPINDAARNLIWAIANSADSSGTRRYILQPERPCAVEIRHRSTIELCRICVWSGSGSRIRNSAPMP